MPQKFKWMEDEKLALIDIIRQYKNVIECTETNSKNQKEKEEARSAVFNKYNSGHVRQRCLNSIKNYWAHQKSQTRKNYAKLKQETYRTGGGVNEASLGLLDLKTHEIIKSVSIKGMDNIYDSDYIENESPNDPVFQFLINDKQINSWSRCATTNLKTALSPPFTQVITGTSKIHHQEASPSNLQPGFSPKKQKMDNTTKKPSEDSLKATKAEVFNLVKDALIDKKGLERKLLEKKIKREDLQLKLLKRKLEDCGGSISSDSDERSGCQSLHQNTNSI